MGLFMHKSKLISKRFIASAALIAITLEANANDRAQSPPDCFLLCKEQYIFLSEYGPHTPTALIATAFGQPKQVALGKKFAISRYAGESFDFITLRNRSAKDVDVGVAVRSTGKKASHARIPYLHMGDTPENSKATRWFFNLGAFTLQYLKSRCEVGTIESDARYHVFWTPTCYFGRPGSYQNYSFLFSAVDCNDNLAKIRFDRLQCKDESKRQPLMAFVSGEENPRKLAEYISQFIYWQENPP